MSIQDEVWRASQRALEEYRPRYAVELVVPEFRGLVPDNPDGEPAIYSHAWDTGDEQAVKRAAALDDPSGWVDVVIRKARTIDGHRIWHVAHKMHLMQLPHDVMRRVAYAIMLGNPDAGIGESGNGDASRS